MKVWQDKQTSGQKIVAVHLVHWCVIWHLCENAPVAARSAAKNFLGGAFGALVRVYKIWGKCTRSDPPSRSYFCKVTVSHVKFELRSQSNLADVQ